MGLAESKKRLDHPRIYAGDQIMYRDDELLRRLMLDFEDSDEFLLVHGLIHKDQAEGDRIYYHLKLLSDMGFLAEISEGQSIYRMTNAGHDFCKAVRDDKIWAKVKEALATVGGGTLGIMKDIGLGYVRRGLTEMGVPLG